MYSLLVGVPYTIRKLFVAGLLIIGSHVSCFIFEGIFLPFTNQYLPFHSSMWWEPDRSKWADSVSRLSWTIPSRKGVWLDSYRHTGLCHRSQLQPVSFCDTVTMLCVFGFWNWSFHNENLSLLPHKWTVLFLYYISCELKMFKNILFTLL